MNEHATMPDQITRTSVERAAASAAVVVLSDLRKHRKEASKLRHEAGYVESTPRCTTCLNLQYPLKTAQGSSTGYVCRLLLSRVKPMGLCDHWTGHDGSTLE